MVLFLLPRRYASFPYGRRVSTSRKIGSLTSAPTSRPRKASPPRKRSGPQAESTAVEPPPKRRAVENKPAASDLVNNISETLKAERAAYLEQQLATKKALQSGALKADTHVGIASLTAVPDGAVVKNEPLQTTPSRPSPSLIVVEDVIPGQAAPESAKGVPSKTSPLVQALAAKGYPQASGDLPSGTMQKARTIPQVGSKAAPSAFPSNPSVNVLERDESSISMEQRAANYLAGRPNPPIGSAPFAHSLQLPVRKASVPTTTKNSILAKRQQASTATIELGRPPMLKPNILCNVPLKTRQTVVEKFYNEFRRLYMPFLSRKPKVAHEDAVRQENQLMMKATAASYTHVAMSILKRLRARQPATCDEDVGIDGEYVPIADKKPVGVPLAGLEKLMASEDQLRLMGYPFPAEQRTETPPGNGSKGENLADPDRKRCSRCGKNFVPKWPLEHLEWEECNYHWGFKRVVVQSGVKEAIWSCCQSPVHLQGACTKGPHVFAEDDTAQLDARIPFQTLPENSPDSKKVVALDCEMSYTVGGMELTRVTVVDYGGESLLDELVRTKFPVLDLNTKWSGVTSLDDAKYDLAGIQVELGKIMDRNTIMIGHGLENDLNAMRLYHSKVIDTAALYPHPEGLPKRRPLRLVTQKVLGRFIQQGTQGHDSKEDAKACIDIVKKFLEKGSTYL